MTSWVGRWHNGALWIILISMACNSLASAYTPRTEKEAMSDLILNATRALRRAGYNIMATSLAISADEILPPTPATFFALNDHALLNLSLPSWLMMDLLHYHTSPHRLPWPALSALPLGSCIPTLLHGKNLVTTALPDRNRSIAMTINGVPVAHPDIYTRGMLAIHGVSQPFHSFDPHTHETGLVNLQVMPCSNPRTISHPAHNLFSQSPSGNPNSTGLGSKSVSWFKMQAVLRSKGYISFSVAIRMEETNLIMEMKNMSEVTVFAPSDETFAYVTAPSPLLATMVRYHIVPKRLRFSDLLGMPAGSKIPTLVPGRHLEITSAYDAFHPLTINNVEVLNPDIFSTEEFMIQGIFRPFDLVKITDTN